MPHPPNQKAYDHIYNLWAEVLKIGLLMYRRKTDYTINFPQAGKDTLYNAANMVAKDPDFDQLEPRAIAPIGLKVRLAWTPHVMEHTFKDHKLVNHNTITFARVLLMK